MARPTARRSPPRRHPPPPRPLPPKLLTPADYGLQGNQTSCAVLDAGSYLLHRKLDAAPAQAKMVYGAM